MSRKRIRTEELDPCEKEEDERYFLNPSSVSRHLFCSICQEVFSDPQRAPCGHSFCKKCILPWLQQSRTCPEDRKPVQKSQLHHDFILENIIGDQMVACPFRPAGCTHIGQLDMLSTHKKSCSFNPTNLPTFLKEDSRPATSTAPTITEDGEDVIPELGKPSLKMRLFCAGGGQRELLRKMFEDGDDKT